MPSSKCWLGPLLVTVVAIPFTIAIVALLQSGKAHIQAAGLIVGFLIFVTILLVGLLRPQDPDTNSMIGDSLYALHAAWIAAAEQPPAYDAVVKTPPPVPATMYYCYCGSGDSSNATSQCKPCNSQPLGPYIIHLNRTASQPNRNQTHNDPSLPSYSEAVKVVRVNSGDAVTKL